MLGGACALRYGFGYGLHELRAFGARFFVSLGLVVACQLNAGCATVLYRVRWVVGSFEESVALAVTIGINTMVMPVANLILLAHAVPTSAASRPGPLLC